MTGAATLEGKLAGQKEIKALESERGQKRRSLFEAQDDIERKRDELISLLEDKLYQRVTTATLFCFRWMLE